MSMPRLMMLALLGSCAHVGPSGRVSTSAEAGALPCRGKLLVRVQACETDEEDIEALIPLVSARLYNRCLQNSVRMSQDHPNSGDDVLSTLMDRPV